MKELSKAALDEFRSDTVGVPFSSVGIDFIPLFRAPLGEVVRINVYSDNSVPISLNLLLPSLSSDTPLSIGPGECIAILKDFDETVVSVLPKPGESNGHDVHGPSLGITGF